MLLKKTGRLGTRAMEASFKSVAAFGSDTGAGNYGVFLELGWYAYQMKLIGTGNARQPKRSRGRNCSACWKHPPTPPAFRTGVKSAGVLQFFA